MPTAQADADELRKLILELADRPNEPAQTRFERLLLRTTLFVKMVGSGDLGGHGTKVTATASRPLRMRTVRLRNGWEMIAASVVPPRVVQSDETVATMSGLDLLRMIVKGDGQGVVVSAEDDRRSWAGIDRSRVMVLLAELRESE